LSFSRDNLKEEGDEKFAFKRPTYHAQYFPLCSNNPVLRRRRRRPVLTNVVVVVSSRTDLHDDIVVVVGARRS
jgi:hypothetical protein